MKKSRPPALPGLLAAAPLLAVLLLFSVPDVATARPELCERAALRAAAESGVPADVLMAIALVESGRAVEGRMRPWPWAANADGRGHWFANADEAAAFARGQLAQGRPSFDLGCFQINWRWHGQHFDRPEALLEPLVSARYAARFLSQLHAEFGSWEAAAGAYHSRSPHLAQAYRARFARHRARLAHLAPAGEPRQAQGPRQGAPMGNPDRQNAETPEGQIPDRTTGLPNRQRAAVALALLQPGAASADPASLVPQTALAGALIAPGSIDPPPRDAPADAGQSPASGAVHTAGASAITARSTTGLPALIPSLTGSAP